MRERVSRASVICSGRSTWTFFCVALVTLFFPLASTLGEDARVSNTIAALCAEDAPSLARDAAAEQLLILGTRELWKSDSDKANRRLILLLRVGALGRSDATRARVQRIIDQFSVDDKAEWALRKSAEHAEDIPEEHMLIARQVYRDIAGLWAAHQPRKSVAWALSLRSLTAYEAAVPEVMGVLVDVDLEAAEMLQGKMRHRYAQEASMQAFFRALAGESAETALAQAMGLDEPILKAIAYREIAATKAEHSPTSALEWASGAVKRSDVWTQRSIYQGIAEGWGRVAPKEAIAWAATVPEAFSDAALHSLVLCLSKANWQAALNTCDSISSERRQARAKVDVLLALAEQDWAQAKSLADALKIQRARDVVYAEVAVQMAKMQPQKAAALADTIEWDEGRERALFHIAANWARQDSVGARNWVASLDTGWAAPAVAGLATVIDESEPRFGSRNLDAIGDLKWKGRAAEAIAGQWASSDGTSAAVWALLLEAEPSVKSLAYLGLAASLPIGERKGRASTPRSRLFAQ